MSTFKSSKSENKYKADRYLVTEQPGMFVLLVGLAVSFLVGYTINSLLSPQRVAAQISEAASHIHKDIAVNFSSAEVSLRYSIFPRFAVVIRDINMSSTNPCWGTPTVKVDELRLPLSIKGLIFGGSVVENIRADHIDLHLQSDPFKCGEETKKLVTQAAAENKSSSGTVTLAPSESEKKYKNEIRSISFQSIRLRSESHPQFNSELKDFKIDVPSIEPREIKLTAKTALLREMNAYDPRSYTNLLLEYRESPEPTIGVHVFGNWREGHYSLIGNYTLLDSLLGVEADLKYIPLGKILELLEKYGLHKFETSSPRNTWISAQLKMHTELSKIQQAPIDLKNLKLEGELGQIGSEKITIQSLSPFEVDRFILDIRSLDVEKVFQTLKQHNDRKVISKLGTFSGRLEAKSLQDLKLVGEVKDLATIFTNKGRQEIQPIESIVVDAQLKDSLAKASVSRIVVKEGAFLGDITARYDLKTKELRGRVNIDEMVFAESVQSLLTNGGTISSVTLDADVVGKNGNITQMSGHYRLNKAKVDGLEFLESNGRFSKDKDSKLIVHHQTGELVVTQNSVVGSVLGSALNNSWWQDGQARLVKLTGELDFKDFRSLNWRKVHAQNFYSLQQTATTSGGWDESSYLFGSVKIKEKNKAAEFSIEGHRRAPKIIFLR